MMVRCVICDIHKVSTDVIVKFFFTQYYYLTGVKVVPSPNEILHFFTVTLTSLMLSIRDVVRLSTKMEWYKKQKKST